MALSGVGDSVLWSWPQWARSRAEERLLRSPAVGHFWQAYPGHFSIVPKTSIVRLDPTVQLPYLVQFSGGMERQLAKGTTLAVQYVGARGIQQFRSRDANAPLAPDRPRPDLRFTNVRQIESAGRIEQNVL